MAKSNFTSNYRAAAGLGIVFIATGIAMQNYGLMGVGLAFFIMGLLKKNKVEKARGFH